MDEQEIQHKHKRLDFTYSEFEKKNKCLENWKLDKYYIFEQIGEGGFGQIYRGMNGDQTKKQVAIKVLDIRAVQKQTNPSMKLVRKRLIQEESKLMMKINSPNVLKCFQCFSNKDLKIMIIEYCNQGSLANKIQLSKKIPEEQAISILKQLLKGIGECHKQKIIHRDLKPENILIHNGQMKIADFGFSKKLAIKTQQESIKNTILGTPFTMAPQVLEKKPYGLKADIWSIGIIFFWMIFGVCPFETNSSNEKILKDIREKLSKSFEEFNGVRPSQKVKKFLKEVLVIDVEQRLGWKEVLNHQIFNTDSKSLPNNFYRQAQIKKDDEQLFQLERQFIDPNVSMAEKSKNSQLSETVKQIQEPSRNETARSKEEKFRESVWSNLQSSEIQDTIKIKRITSQFSQFTESSLPTQNKQERNFSFNEKEIQNEVFQEVEDKDQRPFEVHKANIDPQLPPREYLETSQEESPKKEEQKLEERKKPIFKSLKIQQPQNRSRRNRSLARNNNKESPVKLANKISQEAIVKRVETFDNETKKQELPKAKYEQRTEVKQDFLTKRIQVERKQPEIPPQYKEKKIIIQNQLPIEAIDKTFRKKPELPKVSDNKKPQAQQGQISSRQKNMNRYEFQTRFVTPSQVINMKKMINRQEDQLYAWVRKTHVQCLKTETIFNKIVKVIEKYNMLKIDDRKTIEMMYLLCARCRNNISPIYVQYEKRKHSSVLQEISALVEKLYKEVTEKYYYYSGLLTQKENQKIVIVKDWFSKKLFSKDFNKKDIFLTGVQSMAEFRPSNDISQMRKKEPQQQQEAVLLDYTKQDQIAFTSAYIKQNIKNLTHHAKAKEILPYLLHFQEICLIKVNDSTIYNFKETVDFIIRDQSYRQQNFK